jgi:hypothetical protein
MYAHTDIEYKYHKGQACIPVAKRNNVSLEVMSDANGKLKVLSDVLEPEFP